MYIKTVQVGLAWQQVHKDCTSESAWQQMCIMDCTGRISMTYCTNE